jgi:hypothetical protein
MPSSGSDAPGGELSLRFPSHADHTPKTLHGLVESRGAEIAHHDGRCQFVSALVADHYDRQILRITLSAPVRGVW